MKKKHFLLLKQHEKTGLKYLCYHFGTKENCYVYTGSGKYWLNHIRKHGKKYIKTTILKTAETRDELVEYGIRISNLLNIVNSAEFANLTVECCQTTAEPLQRPEVRQKALQSKYERWKKEGLSSSEQIARLKGIQKMSTEKSRKKAAISMKETWNNPTKNKRLLAAREKNKQRHAKKEFTEAELKNHKRISERQKGKTMKERLNNPNYVDPRKGKTGVEIYGDNWVSPTKGKKWDKKFKGAHYNAKPFYIRINNNPPIKFTSEQEFFEQTNLNYNTLKKLKLNTTYTIKRLKNSKHSLNNGDIIKFSYNGNF